MEDLRQILSNLGIYSMIKYSIQLSLEGEVNSNAIYRDTKYISSTMNRASIKPGTRNIPEHSGTCRNIPEHEKIKVIFMKKN